MDANRAIELLKKHYKANISKPKTTGARLGRIKKRLLLRDGRLNTRLLAKGLGAYRGAKKISESDLEGAELFEPDKSKFRKTWGFKMPEFICVKVDKIPDNRPHVSDYEITTGGMSIPGNSFSKGSLLYGMDVVLVMDEVTVEHETLHVLYTRTNDIKDLLFELCSKYKKSRKSYPLHTLYLEIRLMEEIFARMSDFRRWELLHNSFSWQKFTYEIDKHIRDSFTELYGDISSSLYGIRLPLPYSNKTISQIREWLCYDFKRAYRRNAYELYLPHLMGYAGDLANEFSKVTLSGYAGRKMALHHLNKQAKKGVNALRILRKSLPDSKVARILLSCGPTKEEFESGKYIGPIDELVLWSKYHKRVLEGQ